MIINKPEINTLGKRIKYLRTKYFLEQKELAKLLNVKASTVSAYELDKAQPKINTLLKLSELFEVTVDYLLKG